MSDLFRDHCPVKFQEEENNLHCKENDTYLKDKSFDLCEWRPEG